MTKAEYKVAYRHCTTDEEGNVDITFRLCNEAKRGIFATVESMKSLISDGKEWFTITIAQYRNKRSLNANAYCWELIGRIADEMRLSKEEVYVDMLKHYGQGTTVSVEESKAEAFERAWPYWEYMGNSKLNGKIFRHYRFFAGSSQYDTKEMSILIDGIVQEAKNLGIETKTPAELASIKEAWKNEINPPE